MTVPELNLEPKKRRGRASTKIKLDKLLDMLRSNPRIRIIDLAEEFNCSSANVCNYMRKHNISRSYSIPTMENL